MEKWIGAKVKMEKWLWPGGQGLGSTEQSKGQTAKR
jgi:hypothetical protein